MITSRMIKYVKDRCLFCRTIENGDILLISIPWYNDHTKAYGYDKVSCRTWEDICRAVKLLGDNKV